MRWLILAFAAIPALALWATLAYLGTAQGWWRDSLAPAGDTSAAFEALRRDLTERSRGNAALRLLDSGRVAGEHYLSIGAPVDAASRFQVGSLSKWFTAWGVMTLVEAGRIDLDAPISKYLNRWQLPAGSFDNDGVTARRLLSHTAGLTDDLGYGGFTGTQPVQSLTDGLTRAADAMPGASGEVRVGLEPGSQWRYSGGGYALLQLAIEEVSGEDFESFMQRAVLQPLGLQGSGFAPAGADLATLYDSAGSVAPHYRFSAPPAAGLYTSVEDLTRFIQAQLPGPDDAAGRDVLQPQTLELMRTPHASTMGTAIWGLGQMLYADNDAGSFVVGHDGANRPAVNASVRFDPATGDGIILLVTGDRMLASDLAGDWVLWHTGTVDVATFYTSIGALIGRVALGWVVIGILVVVIGWWVNRRPAGERDETATAHSVKETGS